MGKVALACLSSSSTREERSWLWVGVKGEKVTEDGGELIRCLILSLVRFDLLLSLRPSSYSRMALSADMSFWLTHSLSLSGYPFNLTGYCQVFFLP